MGTSTHKETIIITYSKNILTMAKMRGMVSTLLQIINVVSKLNTTHTTYHKPTLCTTTYHKHKYKIGILSRARKT